jgi:hypothetical protein
MQARVAKLVDAADLKSCVGMCPEGSAAVQVRATQLVSSGVDALVGASESFGCTGVIQKWHQSGADHLWRELPRLLAEATR